MGARRRAGFSIIELLVAVVILLVLMGALGLVFRSTGRAVGASEATLNMMANVRAVQDQMQRDVAGLDRNCFLVIRSRALRTTTGIGHPHHIDQVAFVTLGNFPYKFPTPYGAGLGEQTAHAALVWFGQLAIEGMTNDAEHYLGPANQSALTPGHDRAGPGTYDPFNTLPSGNPQSGYLLGRHATLLIRPLGKIGEVELGGRTLPAYGDASYFTPPVWTGESSPAHISSSRLSLAAITTSELMQRIELSWMSVRMPGTSGTFPPELDYCFRFKTLAGPWATEIKSPDGGASLSNAVDRMQVGFLPGVTSFEVQYAREVGQGLPIQWEPESIQQGDPIDPYAGETATVFSMPAGVPLPSALRITLRVADPDGRLPERTFQQVIKLPD